MLIKETIVLFTSAVRREGGFFKACLKEVSMAPVIFITSARIHTHTTLSNLTSTSPSSPLSEQTHIPDCVLAEPSMDGVNSKADQAEDPTLPGEKLNFTLNYYASGNINRHYLSVTERLISGTWCVKSFYILGKGNVHFGFSGQSDPGVQI